LQRTAVEWHAFSVKPVSTRCKRSLFFDQRTFQALPESSGHFAPDRLL
jgi:hypothetical protein